MGIIAKIYPNGEASLYFERRLKKKAFPCSQKRTDRQYKHYLDFKEKFGHSAALEAQNDARRGGSPLGLVTVPDSTKTAESRPQCKGLTRTGARTLRQAGWWLEQTHGKDQISFVTATIPGLSDAELGDVWEDWSNVVDRFVKRIRYQLEKKGVRSEVIHVTEIQPDRLQNSGQEVPHLHLVFKGRNRKRSWAITPKQITKWWKAALKLPYRPGRDFTPSCQMSMVKYSVSRYLSKYLGKKSSKTEPSTCKPTWMTRFSGSWWGITNSLRSTLARLTKVVNSETSSWLWRAHEQEDKGVWEYQGTISNPWAGGDIVFCRYGRLTPEVKKAIGGRNLGGINEKLVRLTSSLTSCTIRSSMTN